MSETSVSDDLGLQSKAVEFRRAYFPREASIGLVVTKGADVVFTGNKSVLEAASMAINATARKHHFLEKYGLEGPVCTVERDVTGRTELHIAVDTFNQLADAMPTWHPVYGAVAQAAEQSRGAA